MPTFSGRVEARVTIPTGGVSVAASNANGSATATTCTVPAANYYLTQAGGVSSLLTTLQTQLNENRQGYPETAAAMAAAVGYGTWTAGYLCNESSGNLAAAFGSPTLTAAGTPVYGTAGPKGGIDKAIAVDANADQFTGGAGDFDVDGSSDLCVAWVGYLTALPSGNEFLFVKGNAGTPTRWHAFVESNGTFHLQAISASGTKESTVSLASLVGSWYVGLAVIDRGSGNLKVGVSTLAGSQTLGSTTALFAGETLSNADAFTFLNRSAGAAATKTLIAGVYFGTGASAAANTITNFATALSNLAAAINASFSVSLSTTTGLVSIGYSTPPAGVPSFSLDWTSTTLRDVLGFSRNINYPTTAAELAADIGYGTWTDGAGYLCNESSGDLEAVFGTPATLTAVSAPTYGNLGPRGGPDMAIGFDSGADAFSGGDVFDVSDTDDLIIAMVAYVSGAPSGSDYSVVNKYNGGTGWQLYQPNSGTTYRFQGVVGGSQSFNTGDASAHHGEWHVVLMVIDRSTGKARLGTRSLSGVSSVTSEVDAPAVTLANALSFRVGDLDAAVNVAPINTKIAALYVVSGSGVATGLSANLSTALSNFAATFGTWTGTTQCRGLWFPDCPLNLDGDPKRAPLVSDLRQSMGPTGQVLGLAGNTYKRHKNVVWSHVPLERTWESEASTDYASWEWFFKETQLALGGTGLFQVNSPVQIYDHAGNLVGIDDNSGVGTAGWSMTGVRSIEPKRSVDQWTGLWRIEIPELIATGS